MSRKIQMRKTGNRSACPRTCLAYRFVWMTGRRSKPFSIRGLCKSSNQHARLSPKRGSRRYVQKSKPATRMSIVIPDSISLGGTQDILAPQGSPSSGQLLNYAGTRNLIMSIRMASRGGFILVNSDMLTDRFRADVSPCASDPAYVGSHGVEAVEW